jgi:hypothetical protein
MTTIEELEKRLSDLRQKWKKWPKSIYDPWWPEYRVDKSKAIWLIEQIKRLKGTR